MHSGWSAGFSWRKASDATAVQAPPQGSAELERVLRINKQLAESSNDMLPPLNEGGIRIMGVGGNHTNGFLRAVRAGCKSSLEHLCSDDGRLDISKFYAQPNFVDAIQKGLKWTVISYQVQKEIPCFVDFVC